MALRSLAVPAVAWRGLRRMLFDICDNSKTDK